MPPSSRRGGRRGTERVTPYSTNQRRKQVSSPDFLPNHTATSDQAKVIELLMCKSWRLYRVSPLWRFESSSSRLSSYSQQLSRHLLAAPSLEASYTASITQLPRFGLDGSTAVKIAIQQKNSHQDSSEAVLILCRIKPSWLSLGDGFTSMPLLLSQGPLRLTEPVLKWLGASFDCLISPSLLKQEDLLLLAGHYANTEPEGRNHGNIELVYSPPSAVKSAGLSTVGVELSRDSVGTMWEVAERKVKGDDGNSSDRRIEETFLEMISELVDTGTSIQLKNLVLTRISTPALHADAAGLLKFLSSDAALPVLAVLQAAWTNS